MTYKIITKSIFIIASWSLLSFTYGEDPPINWPEVPAQQVELTTKDMAIIDLMGCFDGAITAEGVDISSHMEFIRSQLRSAKIGNQNRLTKEIVFTPTSKNEGLNLVKLTIVCGANGEFCIVIGRKGGGAVDSDRLFNCRKGLGGIESP